MGDPTKKEMTDQEMENFDEKRSEAMQAFSEVSFHLTCLNVLLSSLLG